MTVPLIDALFCVKALKLLFPSEFDVTEYINEPHSFGSLTVYGSRFKIIDVILSFEMSI